jgi:hypothetical protein
MLLTDQNLTKFEDAVYIPGILDNSFIFEYAGDYCVGEHAAGNVGLCRQKRNIIRECKKCEHGLI